MFLPIIGQRFVEGNVLVFGDVVRLSHPDGLGFVEGLVLMSDLLDLFGLLLLGFVLFNLRLFIIFFLFFFILLLLFFFIIGVSDFLIGGLFNHEIDGETNELRVLLDEIL